MVEKFMEQGILDKEEYQDVYDKDYVLELLEDDEIQSFEAGFLEGYLNTSEEAN